MYLSLTILFAISIFLWMRRSAESYEEKVKNPDDILKTFASEVIPDAIKKVPPPA
jgi:hypothetical protein